MLAGVIAAPEGDALDGLEGVKVGEGRSVIFQLDKILRPPIRRRRLDFQRP